MNIEEIKRECSLVADGLLTPKDSFLPCAAKALLGAIDALTASSCYWVANKDAIETIRQQFTEYQ